MNRLVAVVFADEKKAFEGVQALQELHRDGSITLYGTVVAERLAGGEIQVKSKVDEGPVNVAAGSLIGALIGILGGAPGILAGFGAGALVGGWGQYLHSDVTDTFLEDVVRQMQPRDFLVVAEVQEDWTTPVDTRMEELGGKVVRESRKAYVEHLVEKHVDARKAELAEHKTQRASGKAGKMESELKGQLEEAAENLQRTADKAQERLQRTKEELGKKLQTLQDQAAKASPEVQARIRQRIAEVQKDLGEREKKLTRALSAAREALQVQ